jgi:hypothetical protein
LKIWDIQPRLNKMMEHVENLPFDERHPKNIERMIVFLDKCFEIEAIRQRVAGSGKLTVSLIGCLESMDYEGVAYFQTYLDTWKIALKYFNTPVLSKAPYFAKLVPLVHPETSRLGQGAPRPQPTIHENSQR